MLCPYATHFPTSMIPLVACLNEHTRDQNCCDIHAGRGIETGHDGVKGWVCTGCQYTPCNALFRGKGGGGGVGNIIMINPEGLCEAAMSQLGRCMK